MYRTPILFPDVDEALCGLIRAAVPGGTFVGAAFPTTLAADRAYVVVRYDGGSLRQFVEDGSGAITVSLPPGQDQQASALARTVQTAVNDAPRTSVFADIECDGPQRLPSEARSERYLPFRCVVTGTRPE